jgi:predicted mannosyl-3-phosphoglycerate phosphatase (HAD superfamily)
MNILVFTALDDALLDHYSYSYDAAKDGLEHIRRQQIPMIFTTSKTRVEIERLQAVSHSSLKTAPLYFSRMTIETLKLMRGSATPHIP